MNFSCMYKNTRENEKNFLIVSYCSHSHIYHPFIYLISEPTIKHCMSSGPKILCQQVMTGAGQRMPTQQAIILRPGQQGGGLVSLPGGGQARQQPIMVNSPSARVQGPGLRANCTLTSNRNVVINQPGSAAIHVPLQTLQSMQPGQGIPTGQAGHLLVKTENGKGI